MRAAFRILAFYSSLIFLPILLLFACNELGNYRAYANRNERDELAFAMEQYEEMCERPEMDCSVLIGPDIERGERTSSYTWFSVQNCKYVEISISYLPSDVEKTVGCR